MSLTRRLIAAGFDDVARAKRFMEAPELAGVDHDALLRGFALSADPDQALLALVRLAEQSPQAASLVARGEGAVPLFRLLGASEALAEFLVRHPEHVGLLDRAPDPSPEATPAERLRAELMEAVGADPASDRPLVPTAGKEAYAALRVAYRRCLTDLAIRDVCAADPLAVMPLVGRELADLAAAAVDAALAVSRTEAQERFGAADVAAVRLAVIGMGKCGAGELNYISDVDVVYVHAADGLDENTAASIAAALASGIARAVGTAGIEPGLWEVDANLRPEGKDGALSRTLESHVAYYRRWAQSWEFQALLKARRIAGDAELGRAYEEAVAPMIWASSERDNFVESVQAMRRRVTDNIPDHEAGRQLKLGPGGLRDVEFTVQLLQLVHGRVDEDIRVRDTTTAIAALSDAGYIGRSDAAEFDAAYRYLRVLEHRIQLVQLRRTHLMPVRDPALRALARASQGAAARTRPTAAELQEQWQRTKKSVRRLHERIFYRPLLATAANLSTDEVRLTAGAAEARLKALGYVDPRGAMRHIESLTSGVRRRASLQRQLLPILLGWIADGVDPDAGLLGFRRLSEALGETHWYLGMLRDSSAGAERLCHVLSNSRFITDLLEVSPESAAWLGDDKELKPMPFEQLWQENAAKMRRNPRPDAAMRLVRLNRRREMLRVALADSAGMVDVDTVGRALSDADRAAVLGALRVAETEEFETTPRRTDLLVVAMGRQGGREIGYGSDADVMFVHRPRDGAGAQEAQEQALRVVTRLGQLLTQPLKPAVQAEPKLVVDAALRPEGKQGPLVRSLEAYREYYERWVLVWEKQALLRARPIAGDDALAEDFMALVDGVRYGSDIGELEVREIRRIKARVEAERLPRGADPARHVKLGRGGLSDVEWLVQLLQLQHAGEHPALRTTGTREALRAIAAAGILPLEDVELLDRAWVLATRIRSATLVCTGRASDVLPRSGLELEAVARWCGYPRGDAGRMEDDYRKAARRARQVFEKHFYGF